MIAASAIFFLLAPLASCGPDESRAPETSTTTAAVYTSNVPIVLPGSGSVNDRGDATYAMPIRVPDGPNGWQPSLGIDYGGSPRTNGRLGVGWTLAGLSEITPCHQTFASDGYADGPSFGRDESGKPSVLERPDTYCLDGQKLVPDPLLYWMGNDQLMYRTEVESFRRVVAKGTNEVQPTAFVVYDRDGSSREYLPFGHADTRVTYLLTTARDRKDNQINYEYEFVDGKTADELSYRIKQISYAYDRGAPRQPHAQIRFGYGRRYQDILEYRWGVKIVDRNRLATITVLAPAEPSTTGTTGLVPIWTYHLGYKQSPDTGRDLLETVRMTDSTSTDSFVRSFTYTTAPLGSLPAPVPTDPNDAYEFDDVAMGFDTNTWQAFMNNDAQNWIRPNDTRLLLFDADGDGDDDALYRTRWSGIDPSRAPEEAPSGVIAGTLKMRLSKGGAPLSQIFDITPRFEFGMAQATPWTLDTYSYISLAKTRIGDVNFDGISDLVLARTRVDESQVWRSDPSCDPAACQCVCNTTTNYQRWEYGTTSFNGYLDNGGLNPPYWSSYNQGFADLALNGPVLSNPGGGAPDDFVFSIPEHQRILVDLDGDGRTDVVDPFFNANADTTNPPAPVGEYKSRWAADAPGANLHGFGGVPTQCGNGFATALDVDADGRQDLLVADDLGRYERLWYGDGGEPRHTRDYLGTMNVGTCDGYAHDLLFGDWNGDGTLDALYPPDPVSPEVRVRWNTGEGFGDVETFGVEGLQGVTAADLASEVPLGRDGNPIRWDRGSRVADIDGDGRSDIVAFRPDYANCDLLDGEAIPYCVTDIVVFRSRGDRFVGEPYFSTNRGLFNYAHGMTTSQLGDVTGDGALDFVYVAMNNLTVLEFPWRVQPDLLSKVHDSSTPATLESFEYTRQWWGDEPRPEGAVLTSDQEGCAWPTACLRSGMTVVRKHTTFAGSDSTGARYVSSLHRYLKPRTSLIGRGFLGFHTHEIWERERGAYTKRTFDPDRAVVQGGHTFYPYATRPTDVVRVVATYETPSAATLAQPGDAPGMTEGQKYPVVTTWTHDEYAFPVYAPYGAADPTRILRPEKTTSTTTEIDETAMFLLAGFPRFTIADQVGTGRKITTTSDYDDNGNVIWRRSEIANAMTGVIDAQVETSMGEFDTRFDGQQLGEPWIPGLAKVMRTRSFTPASGLNPVDKVVRRTYEADADLSTEIRATANAGCTTPSCDYIATTTTFSTDAFGNIQSASTTDGTQTRVTSTTWDPVLGIYPTATKDALGFESKITMHPWFGTPSTSIDVVGNATVTQYDGFGRVRALYVTGAPQLTRSYTWSNGSLMVSDDRSDGMKYFKRYDEAGRLIEAGQRGFDTHTWIYTGAKYDHLGNEIETILPSFSLASAKRTKTAFDRLGRQLKRTTPDHDDGGVDRTTRFTHKVLSTSITDPDNHVRYTNRDAAGRIVETGSVDGGTTKYRMTYAYGLFDRPHRITDPAGKVTTVDTDFRHRTIAETTPDTGRTVTTLSGFGQVATKSYANGDLIKHVYDAGGRLKTTTSPDGTTTRNYDLTTNARGQLSNVASPDGVQTHLGYDARGRVTSATQIVGSATDEMRYRYDSHGRVRFVFYPHATGQSRFVVRYDYSTTDGHLREVRNVTACNVDPDATTEPSCSGTVIYKITDRSPREQVVTATYGYGINAIAHTRSYGDTGRIVGQITTRGLTTDTTEYAYDADGLLASRTEGGRLEEFDHDALHRLWIWRAGKASEGAPMTETEYTYDDTGNLTRVETAGATTYTATYDSVKSHRIVSSTAASGYSYDERGRQFAAGARTVTFNSFDLPRSLDSGRIEKTFLYDGFGRRALRTTSSLFGTTSTTRYFGTHFEYRSADATSVYYVYADGELVAQVAASEEGSATRYTIDDHRGTPAMWSLTGTPERQYFDPFGKRLDADGAPTTDADRSTTRGFTGHEDEDNAGLVNMQGRIYDRNQFRFLTPDPMAADPFFSESYNPYSYVLNNPMNLTDPSGYQEEGGETNCYDGCYPLEIVGDRPGGGDDPGGHEEPQVPRLPTDDNRSGWASIAAPAANTASSMWNLATKKNGRWYERVGGAIGVAVAVPAASAEMATMGGAQAVLSALQAKWNSQQEQNKAIELAAAGEFEAAAVHEAASYGHDFVVAFHVVGTFAGFGAVKAVGAATATTSRNAAILTENLAKVGISKPLGWAAHHIVPARLKNAYTEASRKILSDFKIDINDWSNGVPLPQYADNSSTAIWHTHGWVHSDAMQRSVFDGLSRCRNREEAVRFLRSVAHDLQHMLEPVK